MLTLLGIRDWCCLHSLHLIFRFFLFKVQKAGDYFINFPEIDLRNLKANVVKDLLECLSLVILRQCRDSRPMFFLCFSIILSQLL